MEWRQFDFVEPIGGPALDFRFGMLARGQQAASATRETRLLDPLDFFPWNIPEPIELPPDELAAAFDRLVGLQ